MEKYIAIAGIALCVMFVGMIVTVFQFMNEPTIDIHPAEKVLQLNECCSSYCHVWYFVYACQEIWFTTNWLTDNHWWYNSIGWNVFCKYLDR